MIEDLVEPSITITQALNVHGWSHLDPIILASLATQSPLLLVGPHGTAKSLLVERISIALDLEMRHYNASLISYDDLVGIPMPDETGEHLRFVTTPGTIWDAGLVFFDEISRCRADLQNKLFPIIHERRVLGIRLGQLKHRWAAMNPPAPEDPSGAASSAEYYLGSEPLDLALTDRFPFVVMVPNWSELSKEDRYALVAWRGDEYDTSNLPEINLTSLVDQCTRLIPQVEEEFAEWLPDYILSVMDLLEQSQLMQSPRRARMLARTVVAVHAARMVIEGPDTDPEISAETALIYGMPQTATETPPSEVKIIALHKQAWEMAQILEDEAWREVMQEYNLARRVVLADQMGFSDADMSRLITQTISAEDSDARQWGLATAMFLAFRERRNLDPSAYEPLAQLAYHVLEPRVMFTSVANNSTDMTLWNEIKQWVESQQSRENSFIFRLERNYLLSGFPQMWRNYNWKESLEQFQQDLNLFGIEEAE